jgi:hypothetical protein
MKITLPISALAAVLGLALAGASLPLNAQTTPATPAPTAPAPATAVKTAKAKATKYSGTLTAIDAASFTISDKTLAARTFAITAATKIKKDGKAATVADFKVGDKVGGSYTTDATGALTATSLNEGGKKAKKAAATTAAPATPAAQ